MGRRPGRRCISQLSAGDLRRFHQSHAKPKMRGLQKWFARKPNFPWTSSGEQAAEF
jgi:hypothetical protein